MPKVAQVITPRIWQLEAKNIAKILFLGIESA